jgi:hypothetical protein
MKSGESKHVCEGEGRSKKPPPYQNLQEHTFGALIDDGVLEMRMSRRTSHAITAGH